MSKFISKEDVFKIVAKSLAVSLKKINEKVSSNNLSEWDSMSHLSILIELDKKLSGKAQKIRELSEAYSVKKIIQILNKKKLLK
jgi:acyl carrier protein